MACGLAPSKWRTTLLAFGALSRNVTRLSDWTSGETTRKGSAGDGFSCAALVSTAATASTSHIVRSCFMVVIPWVNTSEYFIVQTRMGCILTSPRGFHYVRFSAHFVALCTVAS